jgi:hypothetical protein
MTETTAAAAPLRWTWPAAPDACVPPLFTWFFEIWAVRTGRIDVAGRSAVPSTPSVNKPAA